MAINTMNSRDYITGKDESVSKNPRRKSLLMATMENAARLDGRSASNANEPVNMMSQQNLLGDISNRGDGKSTTAPCYNDEGLL
mmetsp:Transcript_2074/g.3090  ORF Transcript_2074/g.3090 Transcript_2074/m.3090 type:complete len:84 (-) Transcript_2074:786-1037(-)